MAAIDLRKLLDVPADLDKKSTDALLRAIKENYTSDFDYLKFIHSVKTLKGMDMDEETAFKSAFATAKTMGFTKEAFRKSVRSYSKVLSNEREVFAEALKRQRAEKLTGQAEKNDAIKKKIESNKAKIKKLEDEIKAYEMRLESSDDTLQKEREKLESITDNFVNSYKHIDEQLKSDLKLFEQYI